MISRDRFRDGAAILATYVFEIGHTTEEPRQQRMNVERTAVTSGVGFVRQQGDPSPEVLTLAGKILTQTQLDAMQSYADACRGTGTPSRTVFFRHVDGTEYEVLITNFAPQPKGVARNPRDITLPWIWEYQLEMEVIGVVP